jgi:hypothetical protein
MQRRDLQVNQLKDFPFDGGGWFRDHIEFSRTYWKFLQSAMLS